MGERTANVCADEERNGTRWNLYTAKGRRRINRYMSYNWRGRRKKSNAKEIDSEKKERNRGVYFNSI